MTLRGAAPGVVLGAMCSAQGGRGVIPGGGVKRGNAY
jgi:hypothetical protein